LNQKKRLPKQIFLKPYEECLGIYKGLQTSESEITIALSLTNGQTLSIIFSRPSREEKITIATLHGQIIGQKIGIMKLSDRNNPILIRTHFPEEEDH